MPTITSTNTRQSLYTWLQASTLVDDFHAGLPEDFDPNREDTSEFVQITLPIFTRKKAPRPGAEHFDVSVSAEVSGRSTSDVLGASTMASKVSGVLGLAKIPIYDYATSGDPQIGWLILHEAEEREGAMKPWKTIRIVIKGVVQNLA